MRFLAALGFALLAALPARAQAPVSAVAETENVRAELLAEVGAIKPGQVFRMGLHQKLREGWHTYWRNAGDAGLPIELKLTLPPGFTAGPLIWPRPKVYDLSGVVSYGYENEVLLMLEVTPSATSPPDTIRITAEATWLVCEDVCIPEEAKFAIELAVSPEGRAAPTEVQRLFDAARRAVPLASPWSARYGVARNGDPTVVIDAKGLQADRLSELYFFPADWGVAAHMPRQNIVIGPDSIRIPMRKGDGKGKPPETFAGTLVMTEQTGDAKTVQAFDVTAKFDASFQPPPLSTSAAQSELDLWEALLFALLGGMILNLMPCVFPVLAMKAASFAQFAGASRRRVRMDGFAYGGGVLLSFAVMAAILAIIRHVFGGVDWGFQFQNPVFTLLMAYLFFVIGLNLSGVFEIGGSFVGVGQGFAAREGSSGSFATGVLAVVVATPCTAPFMAAALGFALTQPVPVLVAVLLAMGVGFALPYVALTLTPALQKVLPRPGTWMIRFKQFLAFPMYASAVWMIWVLVQQSGADSVLYALGGMVLIGFAIWIWISGMAAGRMALFGRAAVLLALGTALAATVKLQPGEAASTEATGSGVVMEGWEKFSRIRMNDAVAKGKPVFVDFTAAWCITCLANERAALETTATRRAFEQAGVVKLKGDWTKRDAEISSVLKEYGRAGVPLYLYWPPGAHEPRVLPQVLTEALVLSELSQVPP